MLRTIAIVLLFWIAGPGTTSAQDKASDAVLSAVEGTINGGGPFRARLVGHDGGAALFIETDEGEGMKPVVEAPDIVWRGGMAGQDPWLEISANNALLVYSHNESIGRNRWQAKLTIVFRDGRFVTAGYTNSYYDTLDPNGTGECDVNLLTGRGTHKGKGFRTKLGSLPVSQWTQDTFPPECFE